MGEAARRALGGGGRGIGVRNPRGERRNLTALGADGGPRPSVLLVAYRMSSVLLADEVVHLEAGRVVDRGTHAELLARDPGYAELATAYERETARRSREAQEALAEDSLADVDLQDEALDGAVDA